MKKRKEMIDTKLKSAPGRIRIMSESISDEEIQYICSKTSPQQITEICLSNWKRQARITHQAVLHISLMRWDKLSSLDLTGNIISNKGCKYLTKTHMPNLKEILLCLQQNRRCGTFTFSQGKMVKFADIVCIFQAGTARRLDESVIFGSGELEEFAKSLYGQQSGDAGRPEQLLEEVKDVLVCDFPLRIINIGLYQSIQKAKGLSQNADQSNHIYELNSQLVKYTSDLFIKRCIFFFIRPL